jgi:hypothetical protein
MTGSKAGTAGTNRPEQPRNDRLGKMANSVFGTSHVPICFDGEETPAAQPEHVFRRGAPKHAQREEVRAGTEQLPPLEGECCSDPLTPQHSSPDSFSRKLSIADGGSHGSHPHADRPNWRPAETIGDYMSNCREGLEDFSERRAAKLLGMTRVQLYRAKLMAELPDDLFELLLKERLSSKATAQVALALRRGENTKAEACVCPNCGHVLSVRGLVSKRVCAIVNAWLADRGNAQ